VLLLSHGYVAYDLNMSYFSGFNRLREVGFGGMDGNCMGITLVSCTGLGIFLCLSAPKLWQKAIAAACIAFMVHAILFSFSRGAMLGLIVVVVTSFLLIPRRPIHYAALVGGALLTLAFTGPEVADRFGSSFADESQRDESAEGRVKMWGICARVATEHPIAGLGPHHFPIHATEFGLTPLKEAHTTWLQLAAEIGVPGVSCLLLFYLVSVIRLWPMTRQSYPLPDPWYRDTARMVIASTIGFVFTAQFVTLPGLEAPYYIVLLGLGALKLLSADPGPDGHVAAGGGEDSGLDILQQPSPDLMS
jgi:putative inorganic carbon (hco3(-)) transporter